MIAEAVEFTRKEVRRHLGVVDAEVIAASARKLAEEALAPGIYLSLVRLEEETALRNSALSERRASPAGDATFAVEPPVFLNLHLLFAFNFSSYATSLVYLSKTIELFQAKRHFSAATQSGLDAVTFPASLEKLVFAMAKLSFEELNNLWGMLGGTHLPSVIYQVRMLKVQLAESRQVAAVENIEVNTVPR